MDASGTWLLRGERTLWTGRPARGRTPLAEADGALYVTVVVIIMTVFGSSILRTMPGIVQVMALVTWGVAILYAVGMLVNLFVITPRNLRRSVYEVTNYRIVVTRGQSVTSVYLDQTVEPVVRRNRDGTCDLVVRTETSSGWPAGMFRSRGFGLVPTDQVTKLRGLAEAEDACQAIASARQRMIDREIDAPVLPEYGTDAALPPGVSPEPGERVLWTGAPASIPWWFGWSDAYFSAFGLFWLVMCAGMGVLLTPQASADLAFPFAFSLAGVYLTAGRVVQRRLRIRTSRYVLTTHRLITTWRSLRGDAPIVVQERLSVLVPPSVQRGSVFTSRAWQDPDRQPNGWKELTWPATTVAPPAFIGLADPQQVCDLIGAAQLASRVP